MKSTLALLVVTTTSLASVLGKKQSSPKPERNYDAEEDSPSFVPGRYNIYERSERDELNPQTTKSFIPNKSRRRGSGSGWESDTQKPSAATVFPEDDMRLSINGRGDRATNQGRVHEHPAPQPTTGYAVEQLSTAQGSFTLSTNSRKSPTDRPRVKDVRSTKKPHGDKSTPAPGKGKTGKRSTDSPSPGGDKPTDKPHVDNPLPTPGDSLTAETPGPTTPESEESTEKPQADGSAPPTSDQGTATEKLVTDPPSPGSPEPTVKPEADSPAPPTPEPHTTTENPAQEWVTPISSQFTSEFTTSLHPIQNNIPNPSEGDRSASKQEMCTHEACAHEPHSNNSAVGKDSVAEKPEGHVDGLVAGPDGGNSSGKAENVRQEIEENSASEKLQHYSHTSEVVESNSTTNLQKDLANADKENTTKPDSNQEHANMSLQSSSLNLTTLPPNILQVTTNPPPKTLSTKKLQVTTKPPPKAPSTRKLQVTTKPPPKASSTKKLQVTTKSPPKAPSTRKLQVTTKPPPKAPSTKKLQVTTKSPPKAPSTRKLQVTTKPPPKAPSTKKLQVTTKSPPKAPSTRKLQVTTKSPPKTLPHKPLQFTTKPPPKPTLPPKLLKATTQPHKRTHH